MAVMQIIIKGYQTTMYLQRRERRTQAYSDRPTRCAHAARSKGNGTCSPHPRRTQFEDHTEDAADAEKRT